MCVTCNKNGSVQNLPNFNSRGVHYWDFWRLFNFFIFLLKEFSAVFFLFCGSVGTKKVVYKICLTSKFKALGNIEIFEGTSQIFSLKEFGAGLLLLYESVAIKKIIYKICL